MIKTKRIYDPPSDKDGKRILVDRLWPRGIKKDAARIDEWLKDLAPTNELRKWFGHDPENWAEFKQKYKKELKRQAEALNRLRKDSKRGRVTLLFAAKDKEHNNAVALKDPRMVFTATCRFVTVS